MRVWVVVFACAACGGSAAPAVAPADEPEPGDREEGVTGVEGEGDEAAFAVARATSRGSAGLIAEASHVLSTMTASTYSHKTQIDGGAYHVDCSGFIDYLLARVEPSALDEMRAATVKRPLAKHYVDFLRSPPSAGRWERVARVTELAPGDIVAWKRPDDVHSTNTGHVMLVAEAPRAHGDTVWAVPIIDSTALPHGRSDSRKASRATGVGRGTVLLDADAAGAPVAYFWSDGKKAHRHTTDIAMGRVR
jgi:hypothetical protein